MLSMTISLAAVFIPILFMEGMLGRLFREFAVTVGVAVLISGVVSLSMTPMMCSLMLKPAHKHGRVYLLLERVFDATRDFYGTTLRWTMRHRGLMLVGSVVVLVLTVFLYKMVPQGFIPRQDTGVIFGNTPWRRKESRSPSSKDVSAGVGHSPETSRSRSRDVHSGTGHRRRCWRQHRRGSLSA